MGNRFLDPNLFDEDWFLELSGQEMYFWVYICLKCDHAGIWRPNFKSFELITGFRINQEQFLTRCNSGQKRIMVLENKKWWLTGFIKYQYCRNQYEINPNHPVQKSALFQLENNQVDYKSMNYKIRVQDLSLTLKDKEKDKEKDKDSSKGEECKEGEEKNTSFDEFWRLYPKRAGKGAAEKAWFKIREPVKTLELIKTALEWQKHLDQWQKENGQFIPMPSTYLNQRRWEDEQEKQQNPIDDLYGKNS